MRSNLITLFQNHQFAQNDLQLIIEKVDNILRDWRTKIEDNKELKHYFWKDHPSLIVPMLEKKNDDDILTAMQSMRSVEPSAEILIKQY